MKIETLYRKDGGICHICLKHVPLDEASRDHVIPLALGGSDHGRNVRLAHVICNMERGHALNGVISVPPEFLAAVNSAAIWIKVKSPLVLAQLIWLFINTPDIDVEALLSHAAKPQVPAQRGEKLLGGSERR